MTEIDFEKITVEELSATLLDQLRVDLDTAKLDTDLEPDGAKFLAAVRKMAHEDPQAIADGFVALSLDNAAIEEKLALFEMLLQQKLQFAGELASAAEPEELN